MEQRNERFAVGMRPYSTYHRSSHMLSWLQCMCPPLLTQMQPYRCCSSTSKVHKHQSQVFISEDVTHLCPTSVLPTFTQYTCPTRDNTILDMLYVHSMENTTASELYNTHGENFNSITGSITDYRNFCSENSKPFWILECLSNQE